ncbi:flagellar motor stator protein MotA [Denitratisoma oestradiolicum]|uniref:Proton conductor component of flagella motor n=1 Tax=Denitratisoma oestradiolicum TaxID=311182 RepID=A0A6S6XX08_9PROT|nr:flagellar motor stator protein MotA [Denitratisoma oestradiolicum]TWO81618.1 flagellar motor stator protein MotA [Denitratisoma oestradiolicum]CAB1370559.1 proton conductor component of flagella motor [Denitratisoma oestradiolicum]
MFVIIGYIMVLGAVLGGFILAGGHVHSLIQPTELLTIGGAAIGSFMVANPPKVIKATFAAVPKVLKGSHLNKALYMDLLAMLYEILAKVRKEGLMSIEGDIESPDSSPIFSKYPVIVSDHHVIEFLTDYLRMMVGGNLNAFEIENLMDNEIETHHHEGEIPIHALSKVADALPAFGIVAAVMGVVHTMESVGIPPAELGKLIAAALVGTFLGILLSYGFVSPVATAMEHKLHEESKIFQCMKVVLLASMSGYAPQVAVEFGRKVLYSSDRPSFIELEDDLKARKGK